MSVRATSTSSRGVRILLGVLGGALLASLCGPAEGATVVYRTDGELIAQAARVVHGRVVSVRATADAPGSLVHTVTRLAVLEDFTGVPEARLELVELGGAASGRTMVVPGAPTFVPGQEVVLCLEPSPRGGWRTVALSFSAFLVAGAPGAQPESRSLTRDTRGAVVVGRPEAAVPPPSLAEFRRLVGAIKGARSWRAPAREREAAGPVPEDAARALEESGPTTGAAFTLLGGGLRWHEADRGVPITWYRNSDAPAPVTSGSGEAEIQLGLLAWTAPPAAAIELRYGGARSAGSSSPFCGPANQGNGLISFEDPTDELAVNVLALGGGCIGDTGARAINGVAFQPFSHAFVVFNRAIELGPAYTTSTNFARIVEHEIGHGIGLGHTDTLSSRAPSNIMYPACCLSTTPTAPALGPDDLAGLEFIYPLVASQSCSYAVTPLSAAFPSSGGQAVVKVATAPGCTWFAESTAPWVTLAGSGPRQGSDEVAYLVASNVGAARQGLLRVASQLVSIAQGSDDTDGDGLTDAWETRFGLDPSSADGADGPLGDPDGDGRLNREELAEGTHPRGFFTRGFAEGATGPFFDTRMVVFNPSPSAPARVLLRFLTVRGAPASAFVTVPPLSRRTVDPERDAGLAQAEFSTIVESDRTVVTDRTMRWDATGYGAHAETSVAPAATWYFAEGATHSQFDLFYLLANPTREPVDVLVRYLLPAPAASLERTYRVPALGRRTVWVDVEDPALAETDVSAIVSAQGGAPIVVERAMYRPRGDELFAAGHASVGAVAPAEQWFFAEGATGEFFDTFLLVGNPTDREARFEVRYLLPDGEVVAVPHAAPALSRTTIWVDREDARLADTAFAVDVRSANGVPVVVERAMWWPGPTAATWEEAHASGGLTTPASRWATADGEAGGDARADTFLLVANTSLRAGEMQVTLAFEDPALAPVSRRFTLGATSRRNLDVGRLFPEARDRRWSAIVESVGAMPLSLVVERATYYSVGSRLWLAGTSAPAVRLP